MCGTATVGDARVSSMLLTAGREKKGWSLVGHIRIPVTQSYILSKHFAGGAI